MEDDFLPDEEGGFIDQGGIQQLVEKVVDALRPLGLTVMLEGVAVQAAQGQSILLLPCTIRPSAKKKLDEDIASREAFNKMLAQQHEDMIKERADSIRKAASDPSKLDDLLFGELESECAHERRHPDRVLPRLWGRNGMKRPADWDPDWWERWVTKTLIEMVDMIDEVDDVDELIADNARVILEMARQRETTYDSSLRQ